MAKFRSEVPPETSAQLMFRNRHRCCLCHKPRKHVHIHHIDGNPSNHDLQNLAVLCLDCHSLVTGNQGLGRKYSATEVILNKKDWERHCKGWRNDSEDQDDNDEEDADEVIDEYYADTLLRANEHEEHSYELEEGNEILLGISSEDPLEVMIMTGQDYERWADTGEETSYQSYEDVYELEHSFIVPKDGWYSVVVCNPSDEDVQVQVDISIWP